MSKYLVCRRRRERAETKDESDAPKRSGGYWAWAELLKRTFDVDVLECPTRDGRMKLLAMVTDPKGIARYLAKMGEPSDVPDRSPSRRPPY